MARAIGGRWTGLWLTCGLFAASVTLPLWAGSAVVEGSDYVVSAESGESDYLVTASIDGYARVVKKGAGNVVLRTSTTEYAGDVVIEEGALYIETAGANELRLTGNLTGGTTSTSGIFFRKKGTGTLHLDGNVDLARSVQLDQGLMEMGSAASRAYRASSQVLTLRQVLPLNLFLTRISQWRHTTPVSP